MPFIMPALGFLVSLITGLTLVVLGLRHPRSAGKIIGGFFLIALPTGFVLSEYNFNSTLDLNPVVNSEDIAGSWRNGNGILSLNTDGRYECKNDAECRTIGEAGTWHYEGFEVKFQSPDKNKGAARRVVKQRGRLRLTDLPGDPDGWNEHLTFEHEGPLTIRLTGRRPQ